MIGAVVSDINCLLIDPEPVWARVGMAARLGLSWNKRNHQAVMGVSTTESEWADYVKEKISGTLT